MRKALDLFYAFIIAVAWATAIMCKGLVYPDGVQWYWYMPPLLLTLIWAGWKDGQWKKKGY